MGCIVEVDEDKILCDEEELDMGMQTQPARAPEMASFDPEEHSHFLRLSPAQNLPTEGHSWTYFSGILFAFESYPQA